jgi:lipid II:glycine glycyltransferase (peptidoglycan interpeptide bridge formation enzyme)
MPIMIFFSDGVSALLPLTKQKLLFGITHKIQSSMTGTYGGWISDSCITKRHAVILTDFICKKFKNLYWRHNPHTYTDDQVTQITQKDHTHVIDLSRIEYGAISIQNRGHRSAVSKAIRNEITIHQAKTISEWDEYYRIYEASLVRWGKAASSRYPSSLFHMLHRYSTESSYVTLWLAKHHDAAVAGALCLSSKSIVVYWHGAALDSYFDKRPVNLLMTQIIEYYTASGKRWFDFNPSGGHAGVETFKAGFGATPVRCDITSQSSAFVKIAKTIRSSMKRVI